MKYITEYGPPDMDTARLRLNQVLEAYETKAPKATAILEAGFEDTTALLLLPKSTAGASAQPMPSNA